ncbi:MAG TPA: VapC toxin family PIN domain ribonuclease [Acetobacteraceae bacterium]
MIVLDTNVFRGAAPLPDIRVERWLDSQPGATLFTSAITEAELCLGVALMPFGRRRTALAAAIGTIPADDFTGRILPFDGPAAVAFAESSQAAAGQADPCRNPMLRSLPSHHRGEPPLRPATCGPSRGAE